MGKRKLSVFPSKNLLFSLTAQCSYGVCFNGGLCQDSTTQMCRCTGGFTGARCENGKVAIMSYVAKWLIFMINEAKYRVNPDIFIIQCTLHCTAYRVKKKKKKKKNEKQAKNSLARRLTTVIMMMTIF